MRAWDAVSRAVAGSSSYLLELSGQDRSLAGRILVLLLRYEVAASLGRRPGPEDLHGSGVLLMAFGHSDPTTEVRGDAFLREAVEELRSLTASVEGLRDEVLAALLGPEGEDEQTTDGQDDGPDG